MPAAIDIGFVFLLLGVASIYEYVYFWPTFRADVAAGHPRARPRAYRRGVVGQWLFALAALAIWSSERRPWAALGLDLPHGWRLILGVTVVALALVLLVLQLWSVARLSVERRIAAQPKVAAVAFMLPHTPEEERWFVALSTTAGFCEELLYRGYLPWFFAPWLGHVGGMILVVVVFGVSHAYQGRRGAIKATLAGAVMASIVLATGSLIPAMIAHALIDIGGGTVGYWLLRARPLDVSAAPAASASQRLSGSASSS